MRHIATCVRCRREILDIEGYIQIVNHTPKKKDRKEFYHKRCFREGMKASKMKDILFARTMGILNKAEERLA